MWDLSLSGCRWTEVEECVRGVRRRKSGRREELTEKVGGKEFQVGDQ